MALFQLDSAQFQQLTESVDALSDNIAKWQAQQTAAINSGFASLIAALTGADVAEIQQRINSLTEATKTEADALEQTATKVEGE